MPITVNTMIVSMVVWVIGLVLKKIPKIPNDMIPQLLYYVSLVSAYAIEILKGVIATVEPTTSLHMLYATDPPPMPMPDPVTPAGTGSMAWILVNVWDWVGRKLIWEKLFRRGK